VVIRGAREEGARTDKKLMLCFLVELSKLLSKLKLDPPAGGSWWVGERFYLSTKV
jgi:hypothetical protein